MQITQYLRDSFISTEFCATRHVNTRQGSCQHDHVSTCVLSLRPQASRPAQLSTSMIHMRIVYSIQEGRTSSGLLARIAGGWILVPVLTVKADVLTFVPTYLPSIDWLRYDLPTSGLHPVAQLSALAHHSALRARLQVQPLQGNTNALDTLLISPPTYGGAVVPVAPWKLRTSSHGRGNLTGSLRESWEGHRHIANKLTPVAKVQWSSCDPSLLAARWGVVVCSQRAGY